MNSVEIRSTMMSVQWVRQRYQAFDGWEFWGEIFFQTSRNKSHLLHSITHISLDTVDGQHPAPPRMMIIPLSIGFSTSPGGAGFRPSTVLVQFASFIPQFHDRPTVFLVMTKCWFVQSHTEVWKRPRCGSRQV